MRFITVISPFICSLVYLLFMIHFYFSLQRQQNFRAEPCPAWGSTKEQHDEQDEHIIGTSRLAAVRSVAVVVPVCTARSQMAAATTPPSKVLESNISGDCYHFEYPFMCQPRSTICIQTNRSSCARNK